MNYNEPSIKKKREELSSPKKRRRTTASAVAFRVILFLICAICVSGAGLAYGSFKGIIASAPKNVSLSPKYSSTIIYDDNNKAVQPLHDYSSNRIKVKSEELPDNLKNAFIAIEDERFYEHNGIDIQGIGRAALIAVTTMHATEGASPLTQQVLKNNVFTDWTSENNFISSLKRKIQEQYLALQLEKVTSKDTILEAYLNTINLGSNTLGVQAASLRYFNKDVSKITISESGVIAAITQNPSFYDPIINPKNNAKRRKKILKNMRDAGHITKAQYKEAIKDDV